MYRYDFSPRDKARHRPRLRQRLTRPSETVLKAPVPNQSPHMRIIKARLFDPLGCNLTTYILSPLVSSDPTTSRRPSLCRTPAETPALC